MSRLSSWIKRFAEGEHDGLFAFGLLGLVAGGLVAISILLEAQ